MLCVASRPNVMLNYFITAFVQLRRGEQEHRDCVKRCFWKNLILQQIQGDKCKNLWQIYIDWFNFMIFWNFYVINNVFYFDVESKTSEV